VWILYALTILNILFEAAMVVLALCCSGVVIGTGLSLWRSRRFSRPLTPSRFSQGLRSDSHNEPHEGWLWKRELRRSSDRGKAVSK
jgi:hypothetical protein